MSMGKKYGFETGVTTVTNIYPAFEWKCKNEDGLIYNVTEYQSKKGERVMVEKSVYIISSREGDVKSPVALEKRYALTAG